MKEDIINRYLAGQMADEELSSFEQQMRDDHEFAIEVALQEEIISAVRRKAMKEYFRKLDKNYARKEHNRRRRLMIIRTSSYFAIAASIIIGIFVNNSYSDKYINAGKEIKLQEFGARGGSSLDVICQKIKNNEFKEALSLIEEEQSIQYSISDPDAIAQYDAEQQVLEWYKAVTYMRMGKWVKARKLLKHIAASDSSYKEQAQKALDKL